jgi:ribosomal protein L19
MITTTLTHNLKQSSKVNMILDTGTIVKKVKVGYKKDDEYLVTMLIKNSIHIEKVLPQFSELIKIIEVVNPRSGTCRPQKKSNGFTITYNIPTIINDILKSPPIRGCNIKRGKPE